MEIRFLGHSAFALTEGDMTVLIDPFLTGNPKAAIAAQRGQPRAIRLDEDDRVGHVECDCPGSSTTTLERVADSTSALNACASVSIGGNVS